MSTDLKRLAHRFVEKIWNRGNLAALDDFCTATIVRHHSPFPTVEGLVAYRAFIADTRAIFPDLQMTVEEVIIEGNTVVTRVFWTGTQLGPLRWTALPPTGKPVRVALCSVVHMQDGKIAEEFAYVDQLGMLQQLQGG